MSFKNYPRTTELIRREYTRDELNEMREQLTNNLLFIERKEQELADFKAQIKVDVDPAVKMNAKLLQVIKDKYDDVETAVYNVPNDSDQTIEFYNEEGTMVGSRPMRPNEKTSIHFIHRTGTTGEQD